MIHNYFPTNKFQRIAVQCTQSFLFWRLNSEQLLKMVNLFELSFRIKLLSYLLGAVWINWNQESGIWQVYLLPLFRSIGNALSSKNVNKKGNLKKIHRYQYPSHLKLSDLRVYRKRQDICLRFAANKKLWGLGAWIGLKNSKICFNLCGFLGKKPLENMSPVIHFWRRQFKT